MNFKTESDLLAVVMKEDPKGQAMAAFMTPGTLLVHEPGYELGKNYQDDTKVLRTDPLLFSNADAKFVFACSMLLLTYYSKLGKVEAGRSSQFSSAWPLGVGRIHFEVRNRTWRTPLSWPRWPPLHTSINSCSMEVSCSSWQRRCSRPPQGGTWWYTPSLAWTTRR